MNSVLQRTPLQFNWALCCFTHKRLKTEQPGWAMTFVNKERRHHVNALEQIPRGKTTVWKKTDENVHWKPPYLHVWWPQAGHRYFGELSPHISQLLSHLFPAVFSTKSAMFEPIFARRCWNARQSTGTSWCRWPLTLQFSKDSNSPAFL